MPSKGDGSLFPPTSRVLSLCISDFPFFSLSLSPPPFSLLAAPLIAFTNRCGGLWRVSALEVSRVRQLYGVVLEGLLA